MFIVIRHIENANGLTHIAKCGEYATRYEAETAVRVFADAHNEIAGAATFVVREMRVATRATQ